jgi:hypothetical protein
MATPPGPCSPVDLGTIPYPQAAVRSRGGRKRQIHTGSSTLPTPTILPCTTAKSAGIAADRTGCHAKAAG